MPYVIGFAAASYLWVGSTFRYAFSPDSMTVLDVRG
jgi:hypothetical protein